jgi:RNA polymerase sigma factor (sigma-70 family)
LGDSLRRMGRLTGLQAALSQTDAQLLERFVSRRDEPAFAALMVRHGPMVLCLCRQMLRDAQEAEDAFQAAFLVLARNADSIRKRPSLGAWLYGVAYRVAARLRGRAERRKTRERPDVDLSSLAAAGQPDHRDLRHVLHEEIRRLPEKYRSPVLLCYLEGKTNEEAAAELRWPVGTVKARLWRAREMLRVRLARRGLGSAAALLPDGSLRAAIRITACVVPVLLIEATVRAAGQLAAKGVAPTVAGAMQLAKLKGTAATLVAAVLLATGATSLRFFSPTGPAPTAPAPSDQGLASQPAPAAASTSVADAKAAPKPDPQPKPDAAPAADVCKFDAVHRLRELVEELFLGSLTAKGTDVAADPAAPEGAQAHPFPQPPVERKSGSDMSPDDPCMNG